MGMYIFMVSYWFFGDSLDIYIKLLTCLHETLPLVFNNVFFIIHKTMKLGGKRIFGPSRIIYLLV